MKEFENFSPFSKVWIYQADRSLSDNEINLLKNNLTEFCKSWTAHDIQLKAAFKIICERIVILVVDESESLASGCSIDKSVHFLANFGKEFNVDFFNKMQLLYLEMNDLKSLNFNDFNQAFNSKIVNETTPFFNFNIHTLGELDKLIIPLKNHWLYQRVI